MKLRFIERSPFFRAYTESPRCSSRRKARRVTLESGGAAGAARSGAAGGAASRTTSTTWHVSHQRALRTGARVGALTRTEQQGNTPEEEDGDERQGISLQNYPPTPPPAAAFDLKKAGLRAQTRVALPAGRPLPAQFPVPLPFFAGSGVSPPVNRIFKTTDKAAADAWQRQQRWNLTPQERLAIVVRLNRTARALYEANPANPPFPVPLDGRRIHKSAAPIPRAGR